MSTKYHHGYRLTAGVDLFAFTRRVRAVMNPIRDRLDAVDLMSRAVSLVDGADRRGEPRPWQPLSEAMFAIDDEQQKLTPLDRRHDPNRFEVAFGHDDETGRVFALLYADHDEYVQAWEEMPEVEPYGYWNNTDRPETVSAAEWDERAAFWGRVVPGYDAAVLHTLTLRLRPDLVGTDMVNLVSRHRDPEVAALLTAAAPTPSSRATALMTSLVCARAADRDPSVDVLRLVQRLLFGDRAKVADLTSVCEQRLDPDAVAYVVAGADLSDDAVRSLKPTGPTCPLDLSGLDDLIDAYLDATAPLPTR